MVLIAIDKHSRKILGYLCRNNQNVAYCCSNCDIEFTTVYGLEEHMVVHENLPNDKDDLDNLPLNLLSNIEKETQLKMKYQVMPCSVQLFRFDNEDDDDDNNDKKMGQEMEMDIDSSMAYAVNNINQENVAPIREQPTKSRPGPASQVKKQKIGNKGIKKVLKKQAPPAVCYLCGLKFHSTIAMEQHQKTHIESTTNSPVFPCKVCGKNVKNLKNHLRQHKNESRSKCKMFTNSVKSHEIATPNDTKVEEASSSTDAVITTIPDYKESENGITSNEAMTESNDMTEKPSTPSMLPPIIIEEYSSSLLHEGEPTQSTPQQTVATLAAVTEDVLLQQRNGLSNVANDDFILDKVVKSPLNKTPSDKKVQCKFCSKLVGLSYERIHVKKYHTNIPPEAKN